MKDLKSKVKVNPTGNMARWKICIPTPILAMERKDFVCGNVGVNC